MNPVLNIEHLTKKFGKFTAVDNLSMQIMPGEAVAFIGQNGAGKSTAMRAMAGLAHIDCGKIEIAGCNVALDPVGAREHLGFVPQDLALYRFMTGAEFLSLIAKIRRIHDNDIPNAVDELLELCDLNDARRRLIREYSGGMARKIAMAGALIGKPDLIILDESFVGLDPESTFKLSQYLKNYVKNGGSILISSHVLEMLFQMCTRFFFLHHGKCAADLSKEQLLEAFKNPQTPDLTSFYLCKTDQADLIGKFLHTQN